MTIGLKRDMKIETSAGPGTYDTIRAENLTRSRSPMTKLNTASKRPDSFALAEQIGTAGPGQYRTIKQFGKDTKKMTIAQKREQKIAKTAGPGDYEPDRAITLTKTRSANIDLGKSPARP